MGETIAHRVWDGRFLESEIETGLIKNSMKINIFPSMLPTDICGKKKSFPVVSATFAPFLDDSFTIVKQDTVLHHLVGRPLVPLKPTN